MEIKRRYLGRGRFKFNEISHLKKSWQMEIGTQVNVIPLNMTLPSYNTIDKATSVMSKNIELGIINYVPLH